MFSQSKLALCEKHLACVTVNLACDVLLTYIFSVLSNCTYSRLRRNRYIEYPHLPSHGMSWHAHARFTLESQKHLSPHVPLGYAGHIGHQSKVCPTALSQPPAAYEVVIPRYDCAALGVTLGSQPSDHSALELASSRYRLLKNFALAFWPLHDHE
jgi:hypothetical protein